MSNKTFIPAFKCQVGDWSYYICKMKYAEVKRQIGFAYELGGNKDLNTLIQRGLGKRTDEIKDYLLNSEHRFLGAIIVAAWGGAPEYTPISMDDPDGMLQGLDEGFGCLTFDGTQQYFALDGQHRLKAIKDVLLENPKLGNEDICVLMVSHYDTEEGKTRTKRLFTNINRNAKPTTATENIALDQDDGFAIIARDMVTEHPFFKKEKLIKIFASQGDEGGFSLATKSISKTDSNSFTTLSVLHECLKYLGFGLDSSMSNPEKRPNEDVLSDSYKVLTERYVELLTSCGELYNRLQITSNMRDLRAPKHGEEKGHPLMRPVIQISICKIVGSLAQQNYQNQEIWQFLLTKLSKLKWEICFDPWLSVYNDTDNTMISSKENKELLEQLIKIHLLPSSKAEIARVFEKYKSIRGRKYFYSENDLFNH